MYSRSMIIKGKPVKLDLVDLVISHQKLPSKLTLFCTFCVFPVTYALLIPLFIHLFLLCIYSINIYMFLISSGEKKIKGEKILICRGMFLYEAIYMFGYSLLNSLFSP